MKIIGDVDKFKKRIADTYNQQLKQHLAEIKKSEETLKNEYDRRVKQLVQQTNERIDHDTAFVRKRILNSQTFKAKQQYEQKREEHILSVFEELQKQAADFVRGPSYIGYVKSHMPEGKNVTIKADHAYSKDLNRKVEIDPNISGIKFIDGKITYDFTVQGLIETKFESLRIDIDKELFRNGK